MCIMEMLCIDFNKSCVKIKLPFNYIFHEISNIYSSFLPQLYETSKPLTHNYNENHQSGGQQKEHKIVKEGLKSPSLHNHFCRKS